MGAYTSTFTYNAATGSANLFNLTDTSSNTGTGVLLNVKTATGSTLNPFSVTAAGALNPSLYVGSNGNVAIGGTTTNFATFQVQALTPTTNLFAFANHDFSLYSTGTVMNITSGASSGNTYINFQAAGNGGTVGAPLVLNGVGGNVGIGVTTPSQLLTLAYNGSLAWDNGSGTADTGLSRLSANEIAVGNGNPGDYSGTLIASTIGIGTTSPYTALSVVGNTYIGGTLLATSTVTFTTLGAGAVSTNSSGVLSSGTLSVGNGGTGATSFTAGSLLYGSGTNAVQSVATTTLSAGTNITFSGGTPVIIGSSPITINAASGGGGAIATSTALISGEVNYSTGVNTIGNSANFTFDGTRVTFANPLIDGSLSGLIAANTGLTYAISTTSMNASITGSSGSVANALTFNSSGGAAPGATFNGSSAATIDYHTIGAQVAGSYESPLTFNAPLSRSANTISWTGLATTSQPSSSNLLVSNGGAGVYGVSTTTPTFGLGLSYTGTMGSFVGGSSPIHHRNVIFVHRCRKRSSILHQHQHARFNQRNNQRLCPCT